MSNLATADHLRGDYFSEFDDEIKEATERLQTLLAKKHPDITGWATFWHSRNMPFMFYAQTGDLEIEKGVVQVAMPPRRKGGKNVERY